MLLNRILHDTWKEFFNVGERYHPRNPDHDNVIILSPFHTYNNAKLCHIVALVKYIVSK